MESRQPSRIFIKTHLVLLVSMYMCLLCPSYMGTSSSVSTTTEGWVGYAGMLAFCTLANLCVCTLYMVWYSALSDVSTSRCPCRRHREELGRVGENVWSAR